MTSERAITVIGAGILGLWQALTLAKRGYRVTLTDRSQDPFTTNTSRHAGTMLAPDCEAETAPDVVREFGHRGLELWRETYPDLTTAGSLVVAQQRDVPDLATFARKTKNHQTLTPQEIRALEPDLSKTITAGLYFPNEAHMTTPEALRTLQTMIEHQGVELRFGEESEETNTHEMIIDCRGQGARAELPTLRGVRGERILIQTSDISLSRPVRLLHPRHPLYIVPWTDHRFLIGATVIESEDGSPMSVRSALELLSSAYAVSPSFAEAQILEIAAGVRPAFPDNVPRAIVQNSGTRIYVNGAYRHGFLLAPVLAEATANFLGDGTAHPLIKIEN